MTTYTIQNILENKVLLIREEDEGNYYTPHLPPSEVQFIMMDKKEISDLMRTLEEYANEN